MLDTTPPLLYNGSMKEEKTYWLAGDCGKCGGFGVMDLGNPSIDLIDRCCECVAGQAKYELLAGEEAEQLESVYGDFLEMDYPVIDFIEDAYLDDYASQYDDDPNPYSGTYSED